MVSLLTITAIAVDRLLAMQLHLRYKALVTPFRVVWAVIFIWVSATIFASMKLWIASLSNAIIALLIIFILGRIFAIYLKIYLVVRRYQRQIQNQQRHANNENIFRVKRFKKSAMNTFLVYILLLCCYMPFRSAPK